MKVELTSFDEYVDFYEIDNPEIKVISNCEIQGDYDVIMKELRNHGNCTYLSDDEIIEYFDAKISVI